jgi:hypothetical protein
MPIAGHAKIFKRSPPYVQGPLPSSLPLRSGFAADLPSVTAISQPHARNTGDTQCHNPKVDTGRGMLPGSTFAFQGNEELAARLLQSPQSMSASLLDQGLQGDEVCQASTAAANLAFHWPSEEVFIRIPVVIPYDSSIFDCVQRGDISGVRELWRQGQASVDVVDPYGLGLLYVSSSLMSLSQR